MRGFGAWWRFELRGRWRSLLTLAVLVAFAGGTVVVAVAGARRGASAVDRLDDVTLPATLLVTPNEIGFDWDAVRRLPSVEAVTEFVVTDTELAIEGPRSATDSAVTFPPADDEVWRTIERPVVLTGRTPDPSRADEVAVSDDFRRHSGLHVGDSVQLRLSEPVQIDRGFAGDDPGPPVGPLVDATIVGVLRSPWFSDRAGDPAGGVFPSPGLFTRFRSNLLGTAEQSNYVNALVRLRDGTADVPAFKEQLAAMTGRVDIESSSTAETTDHLRDVTDFEARSLLAFALAAAVAALFLVGQAVARYTGSALSDLSVFGALGMPPREQRIAASAGPTVASVVGIAIGVVAAVAGSNRFPIGTAGAFEPDPGRTVDLVVVAAAMILVPGLVVVGSLVAGSRRLHAVSRSSTTTRRFLAATAFLGPVPVMIGARLALERRRGRDATPVRPAMLGAIVGVAGVVGALTFAAGVDDATRNLDRFGQTYDLLTFHGYNGEDFGPADEQLAAVAADADVDAVLDARIDVAQAGDDISITTYTYDPVDRPLPTVVTAGRMPRQAAEIALAPRTADALDLAVGDVVDLVGSRQVETVTVTGLAFVPAGPHNGYASGGWITAETHDRLFDGFKFHFGLISTRPGADPSAVGKRLSGSLGTSFEVAPVFLPVEQGELGEVQVIPRLLAGFLALLAVGAVGHALATTVRRRRHDLAVLRAIGLTRVGVRVAIVVQATVIAGAGFLVGIPVGVALGRALWDVVAESTPVELVPPTAAWAVWLAAPASLLIANVLAAWPARRAAGLGVGDALRAE